MIINAPVYMHVSPILCLDKDYKESTSLSGLGLHLDSYRIAELLDLAEWAALIGVDMLLRARWSFPRTEALSKVFPFATASQLFNVRPGALPFMLCKDLCQHVLYIFHHVQGIPNQTEECNWKDRWQKWISRRPEAGRSRDLNRLKMRMRRLRQDKDLKFTGKNSDYARANKLHSIYLDFWEFENRETKRGIGHVFLPNTGWFSHHGKNLPDKATCVSDL